MTTSYKANLQRIKLLSFLAEPAITESGATLSLIRLELPDRVARVDDLLIEMAGEGLVERRADARDRKAKPYFITEKGSAFLDEAKRKAMSTTSGERQDWASQQPRELSDIISDYLSQQPEFDKSSVGRLREVSNQLANLVSAERSR